MVEAPSGVSLISVTAQALIFPKRDVSRVHSSESKPPARIWSFVRSCAFFYAVSLCLQSNVGG